MTSRRPMSVSGRSLKGLNAGVSAVRGAPPRSEAPGPAASGKVGSFAGAARQRCEDDQDWQLAKPAQRVPHSALDERCERLLEILDRSAPSIFLPLIKKVGVWFTPKLVLARSRTAMMSLMSFSFWRHSSKVCLVMPTCWPNLKILGRKSFFDGCPLVLLGKQHRNQGQSLVAAGAARHHRRQRCPFVQRELAEYQTHLAGIDVLLLQHGKNLVVEVGAVAARHRGIFHDRDRGVRLAQRQSGKGPAFISSSCVTLTGARGRRTGLLAVSARGAGRISVYIRLPATPIVAITALLNSSLRRSIELGVEVVT